MIRNHNKRYVICGGEILKPFYPEIFFVSGNGFKRAGIRIQMKMQKFSNEGRRYSQDNLQCFAGHERTGNSGIKGSMQEFLHLSRISCSWATGGKGIGMRDRPEG